MEQHQVGLQKEVTSYPDCKGDECVEGDKQFFYVIEVAPGRYWKQGWDEKHHALEQDVGIHSASIFGGNYSPNNSLDPHKETWEDIKSVYPNARWVMIESTRRKVC